jgi:excisionase family DNA binding protein
MSVATVLTTTEGKVAFTIKEAARASGISRSLLYIAIGRGALRARKCGARTLILGSDLRQFLQKLPPMTKGTTAQRVSKVGME